VLCAWSEQLHREPVEFDSFMRSVAELGLYWMLLNKPPA